MSSDMTNARKWFKKDVRTLCDQLDNFWLSMRPLGGDRKAFEFAEKTARGQLAVFRQEIVLRGLRAGIATEAQRYSQACETIGNAIARDIYGKGTTEFVEKWVKHAREHDDGKKAWETLMHRVLADGLPLGAQHYDPITRETVIPSAE